jgi:general secretion pathway protein J
VDWDGRVLRITRRSGAAAGDGLRVVAWTRRLQADGGQWLRWQSPPLSQRSALAEAWQRAGLWAQTPSQDDRAYEVPLLPLADWQVFYFRGDSWSNPQSSEGKDSPNTQASVPDGLRVVLTLPPGQALQGVLTRDWVRPTLTTPRT